jgi:hypothetical protein
VGELLHELAAFVTVWCTDHTRQCDEKQATGWATRRSRKRTIRNVHLEKTKKVVLELSKISEAFRVEISVAIEICETRVSLAKRTCSAASGKWREFGASTHPPRACRETISPSPVAWGSFVRTGPYTRAESATRQPAVSTIEIETSQLAHIACDHLPTRATGHCPARQRPTGTSADSHEQYDMTRHDT